MALNLTRRGIEAWNSQDIYRITLKGCDVAGDLDLEVKEGKKLLCSYHIICGFENQVTKDVSFNR